MKKPLLFICFVWFYAGVFVAQNKINCLSRKYAIEGAQLANASYMFSKQAYFCATRGEALQNADSALMCIGLSISAIDSALILALDSEQLAKGYAELAKKYALNARQWINNFKQTAADGNYNKALTKQAYFYASNTVADAYHASFYFKNCKLKEEKKDTVINTVPKQVTKLDIDQTLFAMLDQQLHQKTEEDKKEVSKLTQELKTSKDPAKTEKIKEEIKKLEKEEAQLEQKDKHAKVKLDSINAQIDKRDKNNAAAAKPQETIFSKSMKRPADEWDKDIQIDAELPMGLVYQIQIGYYKNLIVSEVFRGLTPIMGKTMPNGGVTYSIGMFEKGADAQQAKTYVKSLGLADAFVIVSYNGKRITLPEAAKLEKK